MRQHKPLGQQFYNYMQHLARQCHTKARKATWEEAYERLTICNNCEHLDKRRLRCYECGCYVLSKAKHWDEICPVNKWPLFKREDEMRLFENDLQGSLQGLTGVYCDSNLNHDHDVTMSATNPQADMFICYDKTSLQNNFDDLGMVFVPSSFKDVIPSRRPFTFVFQPHYSFNPETFFSEVSVYMGNMAGVADSHGRTGCGHPIFAAIKIAMFFGLSQLDIHCHDFGDLSEEERITLNLRLEDLREVLKRGYEFKLGDFSFMNQPAQLFE